MSDKLRIKINIFNCPMPCIEQRQQIIKNCDKLLIEIGDEAYKIKTFVQSKEDIDFISDFYENKIDRLLSFSINNRSINILIHSWVCFKNLTGYSENYNMFPKLLEMANKYNIIATEWIYIDNLFITKIISNYSFKNITYQNKYLYYVYNQPEEFDNSVLAVNSNIRKSTKVYKIDFTKKNTLVEI